MEFPIFPFSLFKRLWRWLNPIKPPQLYRRMVAGQDSYLSKFNLTIADLQVIAEYDGVTSKRNPFVKPRSVVPDITLSPFSGQRGADGSMHKLTPLDQRDTHLFRMFNRSTTDAKSMFKRAKKVTESLREYIVPTHHLSCIEYQAGSAYFYSESQFIPGLKNASEYLQSISNPQLRAQALLDITKKIIQFTRQMHRKRLLWLDLKPENLMIDPETRQLVIADTKGFFPSNTRKLPAYAFTKQYTEPSLLFKQDIIFGELNLKTEQYLPRRVYKQQFRFSLLATLHRLVDFCDEKAAETQVVTRYIEGSKAKNKLLDARKHLKAPVDSITPFGSMRVVERPQRRSLLSRIFHRGGSSQKIAVQLEKKAEQQSAPPTMQSTAKGPPSTTFMP